jgi:hypothetical protein
MHLLRVTEKVSRERDKCRRREDVWRSGGIVPYILNLNLNAWANLFDVIPQLLCISPAKAEVSFTSTPPSLRIHGAPRRPEAQNTAVSLTSLQTCQDIPGRDTGMV